MTKNLKWIYRFWDISHKARNLHTNGDEQMENETKKRQQVQAMSSSRKITNKYIFSLLMIGCAIILPLSMLAFFSSFQSFQILKEKLLLTTHQTVGEIDGSINEYLNTIETQIRMIENDTDVAHTLFNRNEELYPYIDREDLNGANQVLKNVFISNPQIINVYIGTAEGAVYLYPMQEVVKEYTPTKRIWYKQAEADIEHIVWTEPYIDVVTGEITITASKAIHKEQKVVGVIGIDIDLKSMSEQLAKKRIGRNGYIFVTDKKGILITHPNKELIGSDMLIYQDFWEEVRTQPEGVVKSNFEEETKLISYVTNQRTEWKLIACINEEELMYDINTILQFSIGIILIAGILMIFILILLASGKEAQESIYRLAYYDALTDLPNKAMLEKTIQEILTGTKKEKKKMALMFLDINNFKSINDTLGYYTGDQLLKRLGEQLKEKLTEADMICRWGGDEFAVLINHIDTKDPIEEFSQKVISLFQDFWYLDNREYYVSTSIGISVYPEDGEDSAPLIKNANTAMYAAKELGNNVYQFYTPEMNKKAFEKIQLENSLRLAITRNEFKIYYQPQVDINTGKINGLEALIRWFHPTKGLISPNQFIPLAEETGLIIPIGEWVLKTVCEQNKSWQEKGFMYQTIAVNLSAVQLQQPDLVDKIEGILKETKLEAKWLSLEITESAAMKDLKHTISSIQRLKKLGIQVELDDFGTGYCSLNYLMNLPIDVLKIDKCFVDGIKKQPYYEVTIKAVVDLSHSMNLKVLAEGVENWNQFDFLRDNGCDIIQGYLFSRPLPVEEIEELFIQKKCFFDDIKRGCRTK